LDQNQNRSEDVINLVFRLHNGQRLYRRFYKTDKLQLVRDWLIVQKQIYEVGTSDFTIETDFPKRIYSDYFMQLGELFPKNQVLFVMEMDTQILDDRSETKLG